MFSIGGGVGYFRRALGGISDVSINRFNSNQNSTWFTHHINFKTKTDSETLFCSYLTNTGTEGESLFIFAVPMTSDEPRDSPCLLICRFIMMSVEMHI